MDLLANTKIDFLSRANAALYFSLGLVALCTFSFFNKGLNLGIDFTGGTLVELGFEQPADLKFVRDRLEKSGYAGASAQIFGSPREVLIRLPTQLEANSSDVSARILAALPNTDMRRVEFVGPQVGSELTEDGFLALLYAFGGILLYVMLRFTFKFAIGAVVAIIHDVIVTVGMFSLIGLEFDLTVLAAVLAVIGYSLNDTIVVYDRIRENFRSYRNKSSRDIINLSINQTLSRTLVTSGTTLFVVFALFSLGGELIHGFATALMVGIVIGTYSSIFVASTSLVFLGVNSVDLMPIVKDGEDLDNRP
jgi:preprotein translocase subunit SecF